MAAGWKLLSLFGVGFVYNQVFQYFNGQTYGPLLSAYFRKYSKIAKNDRFAITDRKREYFDIDTSEYMAYGYKDLGHDYHVNHGPQPEGGGCGQRDDGQQQGQEGAAEIPAPRGAGRGAEGLGGGDGQSLLPQLGQKRWALAVVSPQALHWRMVSIASSGWLGRPTIWELLAPGGTIG